MNCDFCGEDLTHVRHPLSADGVYDVTHCQLAFLLDKVSQVERLKEQWSAITDAETYREGHDATVARLAIRGCAAQLGNILSGSARIRSTSSANGGPNDQR
jgi:hypothetical protein